MVVYASPPLSGVNTQRLAKCSHLWPFNSVSRSPFLASQRMIIASSPPLANNLPSKDQEIVRTSRLPFSHMSLLLVTALRLSPADRAKHENASPVALQAQNFRSCLCADEVDASICIPSSDEVVGGPILQAQNSRVKARRVPSARSVVVPQDEIHDVGLAVE